MARFLKVLGLGMAAGPPAVDLLWSLLGNRWSVLPQSWVFLYLIGMSMFLTGSSLDKSAYPQRSLFAVAVYILLTLLFWWLGWPILAATAGMLPLAGVLWWLERQARLEDSASQL